ncbi:MAG TPA: cbb3-type cytochrome oxidase assembly protein CcoS [Cytophagales bacterium]|jgi:cbb3-type cytochrome oxidase maturation protein|nr:cbb3-type cytochrome oxidase assembly protein CcoS [Cytophagales bacterium]
MNIIIVLISISLTIALIFLGVFYWNLKSGQYEDTYTPSVRMLFDDKPKASSSTDKKA